MRNRLNILRASLEKKEQALEKRLQSHFDDVARANGQPLNDKRNGRATMNRWDRQSDGIRKANADIQKTKDAIEFELGKIRGCEYVKGGLPQEILDLINSGKLIQWRKHPNRFFVAGVEKARLVWDDKTGIIAHQYVKQIPFGTGQFDIFKEVFNSLNNTVNKRAQHASK